MPATLRPEIRGLLHRGTVIPAHPLALTVDRHLDERRQRALTRYYIAAGAGGIAVGVHTTQFAIREVGLLRPVLELAAEEAARSSRPLVRVAGIVGPTAQAVAEAELARDLGYDLALLSCGGLAGWSDDALIERARQVAEVLPVFGFYLQPAVGGRALGFDFWRKLADLPGVEGIKVAPFNRYQTLDVVRAVAASDRRGKIALYTGNDDNLVADLLATYRFRVGGTVVEERFVGGLLGQWAVWTSRAVALVEEIRQWRASGAGAPPHLVVQAAEMTDANAVIFDAAHGFAGCVPGIHEILRRQGLLEGRWCLDPAEDLSPGQAEELDRIAEGYPHLTDDAFVRSHLDGWLR